MIFEETDDIIDEGIKQDINDDDEPINEQIKDEPVKIEMPKNVGKSVDKKEKELSINDWKMPMTGLTLLLGVSNSGKSQLILNLLKLHSKKFSAIFVFTGTKDVCADY